MLSPRRIEKMLRAGDHSRLIEDLADNGMELPQAIRPWLANSITAPALGLRRLTELTFGQTPMRQNLTAALIEAQNLDGGFAPEPPSAAHAAFFTDQNAASAAAGSRTTARRPDSPQPAARRRGTSQTADPQRADSLSPAWVSQTAAWQFADFFGERTLPFDFETTTANSLATAAAAAALERVIGDTADSDHQAKRQAVCDRAIHWLVQAQTADGTFPAPPSPDEPTIERTAVVTGFIVYLLAESPAFRSSIDLDTLFGWFDNHQAALSESTTRLWHMARLTVTTAPPAHTPSSHIRPALAA